MKARAGQYRRRGLRGFLAASDGAASAEYALILVIIGMGLGVAAWGLAGSVANSLTWAGTRIASLGVEEVASPTKPAGPQPSVTPAKPTKSTQQVK